MNGELWGAGGTLAGVTLSKGFDVLIAMVARRRAQVEARAAELAAEQRRREDDLDRKFARVEARLDQLTDTVRRP